jgi:hypothetical protein
MPSEQTPWEAILDFKADTEAQGYLQGLKVWMGHIARQTLRLPKLEKSSNGCSSSIRNIWRYKLSYRWGTLGGTFVATAEILGDLVKSNWGKAVAVIAPASAPDDTDQYGPALRLWYLI